MLCVTPHGTAAWVRALVGVHPACVFESVWGAYAASKNCLQPAVGFAVQLARLANEVWLVIIAHNG